jgi:hypothetical protein
VHAEALAILSTIAADLEVFPDCLVRYIARRFRYYSQSL